MPKKTCGDALGTDMNGAVIKACRRVEISPHFDLWMRGAQVGVAERVVSQGKHKGKIAVRMDHPQVRKLLYAAPADLKSLDRK